MATRRTTSKTKKQLSGLLKERDVIVDAIEKLEALLHTLKAGTPAKGRGRPKKVAKKATSKKTTSKKVSKKTGSKVAKKRGRPPVRR